MPCLKHQRKVYELYKAKNNFCNVNVSLQSVADGIEIATLVLSLQSPSYNQTARTSQLKGVRIFRDKT